ncbi:MAG: hypothetical protein GX590_11950, partial [Lentisphaerae bacterium]|nr:hypothetical protein [Lentisphaerota bacterium]
MKTRNLSRMLLAAVGTGGLALAHPAHGADAWWQELGAAPLAELDCSRAEDLVSQLPAPWKVRQGSFRKHQTAGSVGSVPQMDMGMDDLLGDGGLAPLGVGAAGEKGKTTLEALDTLEIYAPGAAWGQLAVAAEVKMIAGAEIALVAGTEQPVASDGGYGLVIRPGRSKTVVAVRGGVWRAGAPVAHGTLDAGWRDFHLRPD